MDIRFFRAAVCIIAIALGCAVLMEPAFGADIENQTPSYSCSKATFEAESRIGFDLAITLHADDAVSAANSETKNTGGSTTTKKKSYAPESLMHNRLFMALFGAWAIIAIIQSYLAFGTAYYRTKTGGDNGVALFGWLIVFNIAALIPGFGAYLWEREKRKAKSSGM